MFEAFASQKLVDFFSYVPDPMYVVIEKGILSHFTTEEDAQARATNWAKTRNASQARDEKTVHDKILQGYRAFLSNTHASAIKSLEKLHAFFADLLPFILVAIEVPEHAANQVTPETLELLFTTRKENEDVYKVGFELESALLRQIEQEKQLSSESLVYLTGEEWREFIATNQIPLNVDQRKTFILVEQTGVQTRVFDDPTEASRLAILKNEDVTTKNEVQGKAAFAGFARGKVRIVKLVEDAAKFEAGEILVASMTDPRYLPIMKKAAAIVTDEGGVTCHAAIVSRELSIPCVIGTKVATQVFKDGDMVEVDAEKGIVRRIQE